MSNACTKPFQTASQLIQKMKNEKGITFRYISEADAERYLLDINNYLRTASYRKNYQKYMNGNKKGAYIRLDFAYLKELSTIDFHFRRTVVQMCLAIEHDIKITMLKDMEQTHTADSYKIVAYDDCPLWVFFEFITFGDLLKLYRFFYSLNQTRPSIFRKTAQHNKEPSKRLRPQQLRPCEYEAQNFISSARNKPVCRKDKDNICTSKTKETDLPSDIGIRSPIICIQESRVLQHTGARHERD